MTYSLALNPYETADPYLGNPLGQITPNALKVAEKGYFPLGPSMDWSPVLNAAFAEIERTCNISNWDGEDAPAVDGIALARARLIANALYAALPRGTPIPEASAEPDGEIGFTWRSGKDKVFWMSIGSHEFINYAGRFGKGKSTYGTEIIYTNPDRRNDQSISEIIKLIRRTTEK